MDMGRLCETATKAVLHALRYHGAAEFLDMDVQGLITQEIHELYPLRTRAQDTNVADLEIACDAAVSIAEAYNTADPMSPINVRWFYHCVQSLLLIDVLPAALHDGKIDDRLPREGLKPSPGSPPSEPERRSSSPSASPPPLPSIAAPLSQGSSPTGNNSLRAPAKAPKSKWEHGEIQRMVELRASGMRHCEVATMLGRGQGAVENKYGRVMHTDEWRTYSSSFEAILRPSNGGREH